MSPTQPSTDDGFTLVEIMIVVAIIGLLTAIAIPSFFKARANAQNGAFAASVRTFADAFVAYSLEHRKYPPDTNPGVVPAGMEGYLKAGQWTAVTPVGGRWDWDNGQFGFKAGVSVYEPSADVVQMRQIDQILDDGNLASGIFQQRANGYIYLIEP